MLRIEFKGKGGHSWADFGNSSAIHGLGTAIAGIAKIQVPEDPKTTYNVGVVQGGHSVNSIAQTASMLLDMRSVCQEALSRLENKVMVVLDKAANTGTQYEFRWLGTGRRKLPDNSPYLKGLMALERNWGMNSTSGLRRIPTSPFQRMACSNHGVQASGDALRPASSIHRFPDPRHQVGPYVLCRVVVRQVLRVARQGRVAAVSGR